MNISKREQTNEQMKKEIDITESINEKNNMLILKESKTCSEIYRGLDVFFISIILNTTLTLNIEFA